MRNEERFRAQAAMDSDGWGLSITREEWEEIMRDEHERSMIAEILDIEATLAEEAEKQMQEYEYEAKQYSISGVTSDIDYEPSEEDEDFYY